MQNNQNISTSNKLIQTVNPENAPKAIGPYSIAKVVKSTANFVYTCGALGTDPKTGNLVSENVTEQTVQAMNNLQVILDGCNSDFSHVITSNVFLTDMGEFGVFNEAYAKYFTSEFPARTCVAVQSLPKNGFHQFSYLNIDLKQNNITQAKVEINMIAVQKE